MRQKKRSRNLLLLVQKRSRFKRLSVIKKVFKAKPPMTKTNVSTQCRQHQWIIYPTRGYPVEPMRFRYLIFSVNYWKQNGFRSSSFAWFGILDLIPFLSLRAFWHFAVSSHCFDFFNFGLHGSTFHFRLYE